MADSGPDADDVVRSGRSRASSGRVMLADVSPDGVRLEEMHRFVNPPIRQGSTLHFDIAAIWAGAQGACALRPISPGPTAVRSSVSGWIRGRWTTRCSPLMVAPKSPPPTTWPCSKATATPTSGSPTARLMDARQLASAARQAASPVLRLSSRPTEQSASSCEARAPTRSTRTPIRQARGRLVIPGRHFFRPSGSNVDPSTGALTVFVRGTDNGVWYRTYSNGAWGTYWYGIGGQSWELPRRYRRAPGVIDVFVEGTNQELYESRRTAGTWSNWSLVSSTLMGSRPAASSDTTAGTIAVAWRGPGTGTGEAPWLTTDTNGGWSTPSSLGGRSSEHPLWCRRTDGRTYLVKAPTTWSGSTPAPDLAGRR